MSNRTYLKLAAVVASAIALTACGGGSSSGGSSSAGTGGDEAGDGADTVGFNAETQSWQVKLPESGQSVCYDFNADNTVPCSNGTVWDLKLEMPAGTRSSPKFWTNSGVTNSAGQGGAFAFHEWSELSQWQNATTALDGTSVERLYQVDTASSIFSEELWYAYNLQGRHLLYPNYNLYLINTSPGGASATTFALQVIGYYGGASGTESGHPTIRWIDTDHPQSVRTTQIDATSDSQWVHFDLENGAIVDAPSAANWHIAFRRGEIKLNGGSSGEGAVAGFLGWQLDGFYDAQGKPNKSQFTSTTPDETLAELKNTSQYTYPATASDWVYDEKSSMLSPGATMTGPYPSPISYGFYSYRPKGDTATGRPPHGFSANPDKGALLRSGSGDSYTRFHLTDVEYANPANPGSEQTWVFKFNVQPAP